VQTDAVIAHTGPKHRKETPNFAIPDNKFFSGTFYRIYCLAVNLKISAMKKIGYVLSGFLAGVMFVVLIAAGVSGSKVFEVNESKLGFNETIEKIEELSKAEGWNISHMYNLQATMQKHNMQVEPVLVMSLCKPSLAIKILGSDNERPASPMMPCRVAVYQTKDGKVMVSRMNVKFMSGMLSGVTKEAMVDAGDQIEGLLKHVIK
jgi:uncharacterized protein (DUF302 family)